MSSAALSQRLREIERKRRKRERQRQQQQQMGAASAPAPSSSSSTTGGTVGGGAAAAASAPRHPTPASSASSSAAQPGGGADPLAGKSQRYIERMKKRQEAEKRKRGEELLRKFFPETDTVAGRTSPARKGSAIAAGRGSPTSSAVAAAASEDAVVEGARRGRRTASGVAEAARGGSSSDDDDWVRRKRPQHEPQPRAGDGGGGGGGGWVQRKRSGSSGEDDGGRVAAKTPPVASTARATPAASAVREDHRPASHRQRRQRQDGGVAAVGERLIARNGDDDDDSDDTFADIDAFCAAAAPVRTSPSVAPVAAARAAPAASAVRRDRRPASQRHNDGDDDSDDTFADIDAFCAAAAPAPAPPPAVAAGGPAAASVDGGEDRRHPASRERKDGGTAVASTARRKVVPSDDDDEEDWWKEMDAAGGGEGGARGGASPPAGRPPGDDGGGVGGAGPVAAGGVGSAGRPKPPAAPPPVWSDDDEDGIVMYAARIKKRREEDRARERAATKTRGDAGKRGARTDVSDDDEGGATEMHQHKGREDKKPDGDLAMALFRQVMQPSEDYKREKEEKKKRRMKKKGDATLSSQAPARRPTAQRRRRARSGGASSCSEGDDDDGRGGGDTALSRYRRSRRQSDDGENGGRGGGDDGSPPPSPRRNQKKTEAASDEEEDDLWGDSSVDGDGEGGGGRGERRARRRKQCDENRDSDDGRKDRRRGGRRQRSASSEESDGVGPSDYAPTMDEEELSRLVPEFADPKLGPPSALVPLILPTSSVGGGEDSPGAGDAVPASINRYLQDYQREGIAFLHTAVKAGKGCILGDDMGMGKTVQVIALLTALFNKTGTGRDKLVLAQRKFQIDKECAARQRTSDRALLDGNLNSSPGAGGGDVTTPSVASVEVVPKWSPVLLVAPPSVIRNWINEFATWGHFAVSTFNDSKDRAAAVEKVKIGQVEIFLCGRALFSQNSTFQLINSLKWKLVIVDEYHEFKNRKRKAWLCLEDVKVNSHCPIIGMTGTAMQNDHEELWNLLHLVQPGLLGEWKEFQKNFVNTLKLCRTKDAGSDVLELGAKKQEELSNALKYAYLSRKKKDYLQDALTEKDEKVIFCELTVVQKMLYRHIMSLPDYYLLRTCNTPCDCGVNQVFFAGYKKMRTRKEQVEYQRRHKDDILKRKKCCYRAPWDPETGNEENGIIDPEAVIWRGQHDNDILCQNCPTCILLPALHKLYKVCSHPSLLQVERHPNLLGEGSAARLKAERNLEFAKVALTPEVLERLPGNSYCREEGIMDDHINLSGKMKSLDYCLDIYQRKLDRVLIFSHSTTTLNLIQLYVKSKGYTHLRLDGSTPTKKRQGLIDQYQKDDGIFLFLISTKAGGLGINLTSANKVIIYDVSWNPSCDEQAQDRAFRIGQKRDVEVVRLVSQGTVEELMYARQVYKVHLTRQTLGGSSSEGAHQPARLFRGVAKDDARKGELFGLENLLKFKDGSFMRDVWKSSEKTKARGVSTSPGKSALQGMIDTSVLANALSGMTTEQIECLGNNEEGVPMLPEDRGNNVVGVGMNADDAGARTDAAVGSASARQVDEEIIDEKIGGGAIHHDDFMREDRGGALLMPGDEGFEEEMGGASQMVHVTCAVACEGIRTPPDSPGRECHDHNEENKISTKATNKIDSGDSRRKCLSTIKEDPYMSDEIISSSCENASGGRNDSGDKESDQGGGIPPELRVPYVRDSQLDQVHNGSTSIEVELGRLLNGMEDKESESEPVIEVESVKAVPEAKVHSKSHSSSTACPSKKTRTDVKRKAASSTSSGANFMLMAKKSGANATPSFYVPSYGKKKKKSRS